MQLLISYLYETAVCTVQLFEEDLVFRRVSASQAPGSSSSFGREKSEELKVEWLHHCSTGGSLRRRVFGVLYAVI